MSQKLLQIEQKSPQGDWRETRPEFRRGVICHSALPKNLNYLGLPNPREWQPMDADWKLPPNWKQIILDGMKERLDKYPLLPAVHGYLRALRSLRRQVPLLHWLRRSEEYAGAARRVDTLGLPPLLSP